LGERKSRGLLYEASLGKKLERPPLNNKPGMVACTCDSSCTGGIGRRTTVQGQPGHKQTNKKKVWGRGSSDTGPSMCKALSLIPVPQKREKKALKGSLYT
jgi:hypothetical protein